MKITPLTEIYMQIIFNIDNVSSKAVTNSELGNCGVEEQSYRDHLVCFLSGPRYVQINKE